MDEDLMAMPAAEMARVCRIVEDDAFLTSTEAKDVQSEACNNASTPTTNSNTYVTHSECEKLIENYNTFAQPRQLFEDKEMNRVRYLSLGCGNCTLGFYEKSVVFFEKAAKLGKEKNDKEMERKAYTNLAVTFEFIGQTKKSHDYRIKALHLIETDEDTDLKRRCVLYSRQGMLYHDIGEYQKSFGFFKRSLKLSEELCDKQGQGTIRYNIGTVYCTIGQHEEAIKHHQKCLEIREAIGDVHGQGISCTQLAYLCYILGRYKQSICYQEKALRISKEIGAREMESTCYGNLGCLYRALGCHLEPIEYYEKWMSLEKELGALKREKRIFKHLSGLYHDIGDHRMATSCQERSFSVDKDVNEFICSTSDCLQEERFQVIEEMEGDGNDRFFISRTFRSHTSRLNVLKTPEYLSKSVKKHEMLRQNLDSECKLSLDDQSVMVYKAQSLLHISFGNTNAALFALEQGRAHVLVDSLREMYKFQTSETSLNTITKGIDSGTISCLVEKQRCGFLITAFLMNNLALWFVNEDGGLSFTQYSEPDPRIQNTRDLLETLSKDIMETMVTEEEDNRRPMVKKNTELEKEDRERQKKRDFGLRRLYKATIGPVAHLIKCREVREIIVVPEGQMFFIPFAALKDGSGNYLSDKVRIRLVPSLTVLKLIQDSPAVYHSSSGALIVGVPNVGVEGFRPLPCAKEEVEMIAKLLEEPCLVGEQATKEEVMRRIEEVSVVHIATHGSVEKGELAFSLASSDGNASVRLEDFVLTVEDIARLKIKAKLVVLSSCYGARGTVMTGEGVVGIARAFLASGARSVLMSLWQVRDEASRTFMEIFYKCLKLEKMSASEALHRTQKEMRSSRGFEDEQDWAAFVLLGDDVTLD